MIRITQILLAVALAIISSTSLAQQTPNQTALPILSAQPFAPGVVSTEAFEINTTLNKAATSVLFSRCSDDFSTCVLMQSEYQNGQWQAATKLPFSGEYSDADPAYSSDFSTVYFISKRPLSPDAKPAEYYNLWRVKLNEEGWGEPEYLADISSGNHDLYPSLTDDGRLFFPSFRNNSSGLYYTQITSTGFGELQKIPTEVYGENGFVGDSVVSRNGKVIIFTISNRPDGLGKGDLYISRLIDNQWTVAQSLGDKVNTADHELTPIFSPDNKTLYFSRIENGRGNVYQIDISALGITLDMLE